MNINVTESILLHMNAPKCVGSQAPPRSNGELTAILELPALPRLPGWIKGKWWATVGWAKEKGKRRNGNGRGTGREKNGPIRTWSNISNFNYSILIFIVFHTSGRVKGRTKQERTKMLNDKRNNDYSVQNDESLHGHCTDEGKVRKWDKKVIRNAI